MVDLPTCFMAMPISTQDPSRYGNDKDHFKHVMEELFAPAIKMANLKPIEPVAKGSDLIHAGIVKQLIDSDLVLVDASTFNPNVYFEFGIRTALGKPVCLVRDELTEKIPFDTGSLNHHTYQSKMNSWQMASEVEKLAEHVTASFSSVAKANSLWHFFGMQNKAEPPLVPESRVEAGIQVILAEMRELRHLQRAQPDVQEGLWRVGLTKILV